MNTNHLASTISALLARGRGILAADESHGTTSRRFEALSIEPTEESRRRYRQMLFTTPGLMEYISGNSGNVPAGQRAFHHRAHCHGAARMGRYTPELDSAEA